MHRMMYWIYLSFLVLAVLTPLLVTQGYFVLPEEEMEGMVILVLGMIGFFIYLARENQLFRLVKERLLLQKMANSIRRDLSDSYTYIGSMNRKQDIVKELVFDLPIHTVRDGKYCTLWYRKILQTALTLAKVEYGSIRFVDIHEHTLLNHYEEGSFGNERFIGLTPDMLLEEKKQFFERNGFYIVRSPRVSDGVVAFLIIPKQVNRFEDDEIFKMLASSALLMYVLSSYNIAYAYRH